MAKEKKLARKSRFVVAEIDGGYEVRVVDCVFSNKELSTEASALRLSIQKWEKVVEAYKAHPSATILSGGASTCALCQRSWRTSSCEACPVFRASKASDCKDTPYVCARNEANAKWELRFLRALVPGHGKQPAAQHVLTQWGRWLRGR